MFVKVKVIIRSLFNQSLWAETVRKITKEESDKAGIRPLMISTAYHPDSITFPSFWLQALRNFQSLQLQIKGLDPVDKILNQNILHNPMVRVDKKMVTQREWKERKVRFVGDLWQDGSFLNFQQLTSGKISFTRIKARALLTSPSSQKSRN